MNDGAYRTTFEEILGKWATRKGVVVDTRVHTPRRWGLFCIAGDFDLTFSTSRP